MDNLSIIIPVYNEGENVNILFDELLKTKIYDFISEIIYVNDCSSDNTKDCILKIIEQYSKVKIINNFQNLGQSFSIYEAAKASKNKFIVTIDGDLQNDPKDIYKLVNH